MARLNKLSGDDEAVGPYNLIKQRISWLSVYLVVFLSACVPPPGSGEGSADMAGKAPIMSGGEFLFSSVYFALVAFFVYYMLVLQPERLKKDSHKKYVDELKKNDEVVTSGGILGKIVSVTEDYATLDIGSNTKIKVHTAHVFPRKSESEVSKKENENKEQGAKKKKANRG